MLQTYLVFNEHDYPLGGVTSYQLNPVFYSVNRIRVYRGPHFDTPIGNCQLRYFTTSRALSARLSIRIPELQRPILSRFRDFGSVLCKRETGINYLISKHGRGTAITWIPIGFNCVKRQWECSSRLCKFSYSSRGALTIAVRKWERGKFRLCEIWTVENAMNTEKHRRLKD